MALTRRNCWVSDSVLRCMAPISTARGSALGQAARVSVLRDHFRISTAKHILRNYPATSPEKVIVQRLGWIACCPGLANRSRGGEATLCLARVGRLHRVKDYAFSSGLAPRCATKVSTFSAGSWVRAERAALERQIAALGLQGHVSLIGQSARRPTQLLPACRPGRHDSQSEGFRGSDGGHGSGKTGAGACDHRHSGTG